MTASSIATAPRSRRPPSSPRPPARRPRLHEAAQRYADAVTTAAHRLLGPDADRALEAAGSGPLPWLPGSPIEVREHPQWSRYLTARADRVTELADQVRRAAALSDALAGSTTS